MFQISIQAILQGLMNLLERQKAAPWPQSCEASEKNGSQEPVLTASEVFARHDQCMAELPYVIKQMDIEFI